MRLIAILFLVLCAAVSLGSDKDAKKQQKQELKHAAANVPSVQIEASADKVKAMVLSRINTSTGFSLMGDSSYQLKFSREVRWASTWDALAMESTSGRPTKEELSLTFVESQGTTTVTSDRFVVREGNGGQTQRDNTNHIGKWNLELQQFLDQVKQDIEVPESTSEAAASARSN
jgi:hypothetical protein